MKLPKRNQDLSRYVLLRDARRLLGYLLWLLLWVGGTLFYMDGNRGASGKSKIDLRMGLLLGALIIVGFFLCRLHRVLLDRTCIGMISESGLARSYSASSDPGERDSDYEFRLNTAIKLRLPNGRLRRIRFEQKPGFHFYYHEGRRMVKLHGLPYPVSLDDTENPDGYLCAACGRISKELSEPCPQCCHSLIDPKELNAFKN